MRPSSAVFAVAVAALLLVGAASVRGVLVLAPEEGYDGAAHLRYAQIVEEGRLPSEEETYEFASPPGYHAAAVALYKATRSWKPAQALSLLWTVGLVSVAWLLARELWPARRELAALAAALTAALPIVPRLGVMFHPEAQHAFLAALALLLALRASTRGWSASRGAAVGTVLALAAWTRPTAAAVALALGIGAALAGRRAALPFLAAGAAALVLVAGGWWLRQGLEYGNPFESNLDRYILEGGQPREFYVSFPLRDLVLHPYRPAFAGELWPQFHADLWSDWFGGQHAFWGEEPGAATRAALSAQSVLGLAATPALLAGLVLLARRRGFLGTAAPLLVTLSWLLFVVQLVRFPQEGGDPIKSSYMLYLAPVFALAAVVAAVELWRKGGAWRTAVGAWFGLYALSYAGFLLTSWP